MQKPGVKSVPNPEALALLELIRPQFINARVLPDNTIAGITGLMSTWELCLDVNLHGHRKRFAFLDLKTALEGFYSVRSADDIPAGAIDRRP